MLGPLSALALALALGLGACGGRQQPEPEPVVQESVGCCIEDRWESPPPNIGDTPGNAPPAPATALEPFAAPE